MRLFIATPPVCRMSNRNLSSYPNGRSNTECISYMMSSSLILHVNRIFPIRPLVQRKVLFCTDLGIGIVPSLRMKECGRHQMSLSYVNNLLGVTFPFPFPLVLFRKALGSFVLLFEYPAHGNTAMIHVYVYKGKHYSSNIANSLQIIITSIN